MAIKIKIYRDNYIETYENVSSNAADAISSILTELEENPNNDMTCNTDFDPTPFGTN